MVMMNMVCHFSTQKMCKYSTRATGTVLWLLEPISFKSYIYGLHYGSLTESPVAKSKQPLPTKDELKESLDKFYADDRDEATITELLSRICRISNER